MENENIAEVDVSEMVCLSLSDMKSRIHFLSQIFHGEKELFESDHQDEIHKDTIIGKCFVHSLRKYEVCVSKTVPFFYLWVLRSSRSSH
jgi:hypothetical protein